MRHERRSVEVFDTPSGLGGSHTVSSVEELTADRVQVRVWYGRATPRGWKPWKEWDAHTFATERAALTNKRTMSLFKLKEAAPHVARPSKKPREGTDIEPLHH